MGHFHFKLYKCEFVVGKCQEIVERVTPIIQRNPFAINCLPNLESISQPMPRDMAAAFVVEPNHIKYRLQPVAVPDYFSFVLRIDTFEVPETLREVFPPVVDLPFCENPDTIRFGLLVESLAVGVVVRISEE